MTLPARIVGELELTVSQVDFGALVGITQPAVSDLLARRILASDGLAHDWLLAYCKHLRDQAAGRGADGELAIERARLAREQADAKAMENAERRSELAPVSMLEAVLAKVASDVASVLQALPPKIRRRCPDLSGEALRVIEDEIARARAVAAAVNLGMAEAPDEGDEDAIDGDPAS